MLVLRSSLTETMKNSNINNNDSDYLSSFRNTAIDFFQDPNIDDIDKRSTVNWMSKYEWQFQLLEQTNRRKRAGNSNNGNNKTTKKRMKKKSKDGKAKRNGILNRSKYQIPLEVVLEKEEDCVTTGPSQHSLDGATMPSAAYEQRQGLILLDLMIDYGGRDFIMKTENGIRKKGQYCRRRSVVGTKGSLLHAICKVKNHCEENEALIIKIVNKLLDIGGKELVIMRNNLSHTALYEAIYNQSSHHTTSLSSDLSFTSQSCIECITKKMIEVGGEELISRENQAMDMVFSPLIMSY